MIKRITVGVMMLAMAGCTPSTPAQGQTPISKFNSKGWTTVPMVNGPALHVACYEGHKIVLVDSYLSRENEYHLTSPKSLAIIQGGCNGN